MKKNLLLAVLLAVFSLFTVNADEGMWIPGYIPESIYTQMQKMGLELSQEGIASFNESSLKDAIFQLQDASGTGFCTGEIVSKQGLMFTNHHCAYPAIVDVSTVENNYLDDGFWASNHSEEIPLKNINVSRVVKIKDVSSEVLEEISDTISENDRQRYINRAIEKIEKEAQEDNNYSAKVHSMYQGSEFYLYIYEVFGDVRLVGTPPNAIGKFGGDTDNWMWPRHTGDFAVLRVYMSPEGEPTKAFNEDNIPYQPLHSLPISIRGIEEGDFAMIMGFPGVTERFLSSYGMEYKRDYFNPTIIDLFEIKVDIMLEEMQKDDAVRLAYTDSYAQMANGHKLFQGERLTLKTTDAIDQRRKYEEELSLWINQDSERQEKYGEILENIKNEYKTYGPTTKNMLYLFLGLVQASEKVMLTQEYMALNNLLENKSKNINSITAISEEFLEGIDDKYDSYYPHLDKRLFMASLKKYLEEIPEEERNPVFDEFIFDEYSGSFFRSRTEDEMLKAFVDDVFENSIFTDKNRIKNFLKDPDHRSLNRDPLFTYAKKVLGDVMQIQMAYSGAMNNLSVYQRHFINAMREYEPERDFYPDANSTLRLSYGSIESYQPREAVHFRHITYIDGIIEKKDPNHFEFVVPGELVEAYEQRNFGRYVDNTGNLPVNFLSSNDITGGNSGSPVLNSKGELIGIAFDGNWEWLCSNLIYNPDLQRTINVDARYVLWVIDKLYNAHNIINELDIRE